MGCGQLLWHLCDSYYPILLSFYPIIPIIPDPIIPIPLSGCEQLLRLPCDRLVSYTQSLPALVVRPAGGSVKNRSAAFVSLPCVSSDCSPVILSHTGCICCSYTCDVPSWENVTEDTLSWKGSSATTVCVPEDQVTDNSGCLSLSHFSPKTPEGILSLWVTFVNVTFPVA